VETTALGGCAGIELKSKLAQRRNAREVINLLGVFAPLREIFFL
jgi:hypothetical protein